MTEISQPQIDLNSHYTTTPKVEIPQHVVVSPPENIPSVHIFNDIDATNRLNGINQDIFEQSKQHTPKKKKKFLGIF